ncbi:hypothetical protein CMU87_17010 [Elizabethkingia anophelis]|nr:hypothetical protein [Elizabethkingia anophelis]
MSSFLIFKQYPFEGKTKRFMIHNSVNKSILGRVLYYPQWRKYVFVPIDGVIFDSKCLIEIYEFLDNENNERKELLKLK